MAERARADGPEPDVAHLEVSKAVGEHAGAAVRAGIAPVLPEAPRGSAPPVRAPLRSGHARRLGLRVERSRLRGRRGAEQGEGTREGAERASGHREPPVRGSQFHAGRRSAGGNSRSRDLAVSADGAAVLVKSEFGAVRAAVRARVGGQAVRISDSRR
jgi:hypothetical protein